MLSGLLRETKKETPPVGIDSGLEILSGKSTAELTSGGIPAENSAEQQNVAVVSSEISAKQSTDFATKESQFLSAVPDDVARETKEALTTREEALLQPPTSTTTIEDQNQKPVENSLMKTEKGPRRPTKESSQRRRHRGALKTAQKKEFSSDAKSKAGPAKTEATKAIGTAAIAVDHPATSLGVHVNCRKTAAALETTIKNWESVVRKILNEAQSTNMSSDVRLAAIKSICNDALAEPRKLMEPDRNSKKNSKREHLNNGKASKQIVGHSPNQRGQTEERRFPDKYFRGRGRNHLNPFYEVPYYDDKNHNSRPTHNNKIEKSNTRTNTRLSYHHMSFPQWEQRSSPKPSLVQTHNRLFQKDPSFLYSPAPNGVNRNEQFNSLFNSAVASQQTLPLLNSAAESDHPICVSIREEFRRVEDVESLTKLIMKAEAHKIHDLVDRGRRKLEKLIQQQPKQSD